MAPVEILIRNTDPDSQRSWIGIQFESGSTTLRSTAEKPRQPIQSYNYIIIFIIIQHGWTKAGIVVRWRSLFSIQTLWNWEIYEAAHVPVIIFVYRQ